MKKVFYIYTALCLLCSGGLSGFCSGTEELFFREDWKEIPAATPVTQEHVQNPELLVFRHGPAGDQIKKSHHDQIVNDPWYIWSGSCEDGHWAISLRKEETLVDLREGKIVWRTKQQGGHVLKVILELENGTWLVSDAGFGETPDWHEFSVKPSQLTWSALDIKTIQAGERVRNPDLSRVRSVGWTDLMKGEGSAGCTRVDWIEVYGKAVN